MIDINKMRRLAKEQEWIGRWYDAGCETLMAERNGEHEEVAHPIPIGLVPYLIAVQPASILELLDRLEAAEKERDNANAAAVNIALEAERLQCENDALRAKITETKKQEPVRHEFQGRDGDWYPFINQRHYENTVADGTWPIRALYALPGAQGE